MREYRKIYYHCGYMVDTKSFGSFDYQELVGMATGSGSSDVVFRCKNCNERYRVTCPIRYSTRKKI